MTDNDMTEKIGKVILDYSKYPGEDYYCDGAVEDELLEIVCTEEESDYTRIIQKKKSWPVLYHLSPLRENIVDWIPFKPSDKILEVGSGCGAITGALARKAGSVVCVDLSRKRSLINAHRHKECDNITIHVGNFKDLEPHLADDFDYICLIGVFEYGQSYIGGETPFEDFLEILKRHLSPGGRLLIAIENKYGLKYFAGCKEDHLGTYFGGIENYSAGGGVRTFGRSGLEQLFAACGFKQAFFYYPYPDYKFMTSLYSDSYLPGKGELSNNIRNFDRDRMLLFHEKDAFDGILEEGLFPVFSNSYFVVLGKAVDTMFVKFSNDRAKEFAVRTQIDRDRKKGIIVRKYPLTAAARDHIRGMAAAYENLTKRYQNGNLHINPCTLSGEDELVHARFTFEAGIPLSELMDGCLEKDDIRGFMDLFHEYLERIGYREDYPAADYDMIFSNLLVKGDTWTLIDYEWTFGRIIATKELAFRAIYCYLLEDEKRSKFNPQMLLQELGITEEEAEGYREQEAEFQKFVTGQQYSMAQMRDLIGYRLLEPRKWIDRYQDSQPVNRVQIYEDYGSGFTEENSYFVKEAYQGENLIEFSVDVKDGVRILRIDPAMDSCMVKILAMNFNENKVPLHNRKIMWVNGKAVKDTSGEAAGYRPSVIFSTTDPGISIRLESLEQRTENRLYVKMEIIRVPTAMAQDMANAVKKIF